MKIKLILQPEQFTSFTSWYLEPLWREYFDIGLYNESSTYSKHTLFVFWCANADDPLVNRLHEQGHKVVIDNLWEMPNLDYSKNHYELNNRNWCWYNESLWWRSLEYHNYVPKKSYKRTSFMPIRRSSQQRNIIVESLGSRLDNFIWSYQDKTLPNDSSTTDPNYQRFFNPEWYNDTYFSTVLESIQLGPCWWPTEKTFKACAYYHPFLIIGQHHTLKYLKQLRFETYDNLFDESYDDIEEFDMRLNAVIKNVDNFNPVPYDTTTNEKLQHNHNLFFDEQLVKDRIVREIIEPLIEYAET
jgi:hypothetical protein